MIQALIIALSTIINRLSGDDRWMRAGFHEQGAKWLAGRPLPYTSLLMALLALPIHAAEVAPAFGLSYFLWRVLAWGRWFDLGRMPDGFNRVGIEPEPYAKIIIKLSGGSDHLALFLRHLMVVPGLVLVGWLLSDWWTGLVAGPVFALALTLAYEAGWRLSSKNPIMTAELICGALWGLLIVSA